jgi:hypothetical protein
VFIFVIIKIFISLTHKKIVMKKRLLTALAVISLSFTQAQEVKFGTKVGLNISNLAGDISDANNKIGFHIGGFAEIELSDMFSLQPEILYSTQGTKSEQNFYFPSGGLNIDLTQKLSYLNIPIMAKLYLVENFYIEVGPQIGFLLTAEQIGEASGSIYGQPYTSSETIDNKDSLNSTDYGLNMGLGIKLSERFGAGVRYSLGLSNIDKETKNSEVNNRNIGISLMYNL